MSDLQPTPMSLFNEVTDINNFNGDSKIPFLDANATTTDKINALIKYKNFKDLLINDILPISDSEIETGINSNNINTGLLSSISQIQVNQYGRVVRIDGSTSSSSGGGGGGSTGSGNFDVGNVVSITNYNSPSNVTQSSNYQTVYNGKVSITGVATFLSYPGLQNFIGTGNLSLTLAIKSNIKQTGVPISNTIIQTFQGTSSRQTGNPLSQGYTLYISGIIPCVQGETNWLLTMNNTNYPFWNLTSNLTFFNYPQ